MSDIVPTIKAQYAKFFLDNDWIAFKQLADYYLEVSTHLKKSDIPAAEHLQLWIRNVQKRLFIGIACELLLKAHYLKQGYGINTPIEKSPHLYQIETVDPYDYKPGDTYPMGFMLDKLKHGPKFRHEQVIERGFYTALVFRNKEGHIAVHWHRPEPKNYSDIEDALVEFYKEAFGQNLSIQISFEKDEAGNFQID